MRGEGDLNITLHLSPVYKGPSSDMRNLNAGRLNRAVVLQHTAHYTLHNDHITRDKVINKTLNTFAFQSGFEFISPLKSLDWMFLKNLLLFAEENNMKPSVTQGMQLRT